MHVSDVLFTNKPALEADSLYQMRRADSRLGESNLYLVWDFI